MALSKTKIDRAGNALAKDEFRTIEEGIELEDVFDEFRSAHLQPLTELTIELQNWLTEFDAKYYIAQRLKRKPQIVRKLRRLKVRLSQLQDIGGCRIIVSENSIVDRLYKFIKERSLESKAFTVTKVTDYREKGRDDSGYRALHLLISHSGQSLELQIRSQVQHYWAESIERTSVIYGHHLKEQDGDLCVINYFKSLSDIFNEIEHTRKPTTHQTIELDKLRSAAENIIKLSDKNRISESFVNEDIIKTLSDIEARQGGFNNWVFVFDWNTGSFTTWDIIDRASSSAITAYVNYERQFPANQGYEVVMIGSSDVATVRQTHSHYFGIANYDSILEKLDQSIVGFSRRMDIDADARQILLALYNKSFWNQKRCSLSTLKNHYCKPLMSFDSSLKVLQDKGIILTSPTKTSVSLNPRKTNEIEQYL